MCAHTKGIISSLCKDLLMDKKQNKQNIVQRIGTTSSLKINMKGLIKNTWEAIPLFSNKELPIRSSIRNHLSYKK